MEDYTQVIVTAKDGTQLLNNGTGSGDMSTIACGKFPKGSRPSKGVLYDIQALPDDVQFPMDWEATCTFSGETSEFKSDV